MEFELELLRMQDLVDRLIKITTNAQRRNNELREELNMKSCEYCGRLNRDSLSSLSRI